ncbi:CIA30 family protein [Anianabacter salinae]|uniref:CIA30 family protein n=1 Tax=Anianabacter salinae TaxID=2851023 RepID=UPI00225E4F0F|nr:CIA30 family protein [Anianabacter salinae]MBV0913226.1 CIA30 family protein [Anianabacter salinae]
MDRRHVLALAAASLVLPRAALTQDWTTGMLTPARDLGWTYLADTVMGGVSQGQARMETDGPETFIRLTGTVSTANRGGFIQTRTDLPGGLPPETTALRIRLRGNGERYFIHLRTSGTRLPWQYYQAGFPTGPDWAEIDLPLSSFEPSGRLLRSSPQAESLRSIGLVAFGRDHRADVSLAALGAV